MTDVRWTDGARDREKEIRMALGSGRPEDSLTTGAPASGLTPLTDDDPLRVGPHRLVGRIGEGGMGVVYGSVDEHGEPVAVKVIRPELAADPDFRARFAREVALTTRVSGEYVVRLRSAEVDADPPWLATDYVEGPDLGALVAEQGPLPGPLVRDLGAGVARALESIHAVGVTHRDLKPGNILITGAGPRVLDFGIASAVDQTALTRTGGLVGSPGWISPEQYRGESTSQASDVFAWGLVVAYAATGRHPFGTGAPDALAYRILGEEPDLSGVTARLRPLVARCLAKQPTERPSVTEVVRAVMADDPEDELATVDLASAEPASIEPSSDPRAPGSAGPDRRAGWSDLIGAPGHTRTWATLAPPARDRRRRMSLLVGGALVALLCVAALALPPVQQFVRERTGQGEETDNRVSTPTVDAENAEGNAADQVTAQADGDEDADPELLRLLEEGENVVRATDFTQLTRYVRDPDDPDAALGELPVLRLDFDAPQAVPGGVRFGGTATYLLDFGSRELRAEDFYVAVRDEGGDGYGQIDPEGDVLFAELNPAAPEAEFSFEVLGVPSFSALFYRTDPDENLTAIMAAIETDTVFSVQNGLCYDSETGAEGQQPTMFLTGETPSTHTPAGCARSPEGSA